MALSLRHLIAAVALGLLTMQPSLLAQPAEPKPALKVRFFYIGYDYSARALTYPELQAKFGEPKKSTDLRLAPNALSAVYDYSGPLPLVLYREVKQDDRLVRQPLAELSCPPDWRGVLFLITPADQTAPFPFNFTPIEYWGDTIPENTVRILNLCPVPLAFKAAGTSNIIASRASADFPVSADSDSLPLMAARLQGDTWQAVISTTRPKPEASRSLMLAFPDAPEFNTVRLLQLDNPPQSPPPAPAR